MSIRDKLVSRMNESPPPIEASKKFLRSFFSDSLDLQEVYDEIKDLASQNPRSILRGLRGIEALLEEPSENGILSNLVAWEANYVLDDPSDIRARAWLEDVVRNTKQILSEVGANR